MAIRSGQIIHDAQGFVVQRIQTGGVSNLNIPNERIYEDGNYNSVAIVRDIPDLTFDIESFAVTCDLEALVHGVDPTTVVNGDLFDFQTTFPIDVISPFRSGNGKFNIVKGIAVPYLTLDTVSYKFGVKQNADQTFSLRGDSIYYIPGSPFYEKFTLVNNTLTYNLAHTAISYDEQGNTLYILGACVENPSTGLSKRLFFGTQTGQYTNTSTTITLADDWFDSGYSILKVVYGSLAASTYNASVNVPATVTPAAVRSKDINVFVSDGAATPTLLRWHGVQSVDMTRKVSINPDEEFGNPKYVSYDPDTVDVNGQIVVRSFDAEDLWDKVAQVAGVSTSNVSGLQTANPLELQIVINDPVTGSPLKTFNIPDAIFDAPGASAKANQKLDVTFKWNSNESIMQVYKGAKP